MSTAERPRTTDNLVRAAELIIVAQYGSQTMLERKLRIAHDEAGALLDELQLAGVVGPPTDTGTRPLLVTSDELDVALRKVREHAARQRLVVESEALDEAHGGEVVLRGGLGVAEVRADVPGGEVAVRADAVVAEPKREPQRAAPQAIWGTIAQRPVHALRESPKTRTAATAGLTCARHVWTIGAGFKSWTCRAMDAANFKDHKRTIAALQQTGQYDAATRAQDSLTKAKAERRAGLLAMPKKVLAVGAVLGIGLVVLLLVNLLIAIGVQLTPNTSPDDWDFMSWWAFVNDVVQWIAWAVQWAAILGAVAAGPILLIWAWREGDRAANKPKFLLTKAQAAMLGSEITPHKAVIALRDLGIAKLRQDIEIMLSTDTAGGMLSPIRTAGCGTEWDARLTSGVSTDEVLKRRRKAAENLDRHEHELFMSVPAPRTIRFWAADSGELDKPIPPSPLVLDSTLKADVYTGRAPWGLTMRGDMAALSVHQRHLLVTGLSNQGKALATDTPIPTPSGWTTMGELQVGDQVFGLDGRPCNVTGAFDVMHDHECFDVEFSDGTVITADAEHLWFTETTVSRRSARAWQERPEYVAPRGTDQRHKREMASVKTTAQIAATVRHVTVSRNEANHSIPVAAPIQLADVDLPLDPYTLGYWLGDGSSAGARLTCGDDDVAHVTDELTGAGLHWRARRERTAWSVTFSTHPLDRIAGRSGRSATNVLRQLGVLHNKHIPAAYLRASESQRRALLAGLLDSDGTINPKEGMVEFGVCSQQLADGFAELAQSLGFKIRRSTKRVKGKTEATSTCHKVTFRPRLQVFRLKRKADLVWIGKTDWKSGRRYIVDVWPAPSVPVRCIAVDSPDHLFLASRAFIATHNTAAVRSLALWVALDVTTELRVADLKGIGDWHMFDGIATVLIEGPADGHVIAAAEMLEAAVVEMERRLGALDKDEYPNGVPRDLARRRGSGFHPLICIVDEAQQAFMCPAVGDDKRPYGGTKATSRYFNAARKIHNQGRAVNVTLWQGTQDPTNENLPKLIREGAHIRGCLAVGTEEQARMALGDKAVAGGAAPHQLRQGIDKGTLVLNGEGFEMQPGQSSINVRTHYIDGDTATEIARRAADLRAKAGRALQVPEAIAAPEVDFLADVAEVMDGEPRVTTTTLLKLLAQENPAEYGGRFDAKALAARLRDEGIEPKKLNSGQRYVLAEQVDAAFRRRDD